MPDHSTDKQSQQPRIKERKRAKKERKLAKRASVNSEPMQDSPAAQPQIDVKSAAAEESGDDSESNVVSDWAATAEQETAAVVEGGYEDATTAVEDTNSFDTSPEIQALQERTGMPALDLLYGPSFPALTTQDQVVPIAQRLTHALKKRCKASRFVTQGRTIYYYRINAAFYSEAPNSFSQRLLKYLASAVKFDTAAEHVHQWIEHELYYIVCWNRDAFPEIAELKNDYLDVFPALFPGSYASMFLVLAADGVNGDEIDFSQKQQTAALIFNTLLKRVRTLAPNSHLLIDDPDAVTAQPFVDLDEKLAGETKEAAKLRRGRWKKAHEGAPENLLTLAHNAENFQTGLVRTIEAASANKWATAGKTKHEVESYMYRLAKKEPRAFPEVFAVNNYGKEKQGGDKKELGVFDDDAFDESQQVGGEVLIDLL